MYCLFVIAFHANETVKLKNKNNVNILECYEGTHTSQCHA